MIQYALYTAPGGALIGDYSGRVQGLTFATNNRGFAECTGFVPMGPPEAFSLYDRAGLPHVMVNDSASGVSFEGRLEDVTITSRGVKLTALGYARALSDATYTALWSDSSVSSWRVLTNSMEPNTVESRYTMDARNRLFITPQKNALFGSTGTQKGGGLYYDTPDRGSRKITGVSFDFQINAPDANWQADLHTYTLNPTAYITSVWTKISAAGATVGTMHLSGITGADRLLFFFRYAPADAVYAGETGTTFLVVTNVRLVTTTTNRVNTTHTVARAAGVNVTATVGSTANMYVGQLLGIGATGVTIGESVVVKQILSSTQFVADFTAAAAIGIAVQAHVVYADEIVKDMVSATATLNSTQLNTSTALIQSPALDLQNERYEDARPADVLDRLVRLGDNQTTPRQWEWGVYSDRRLYYRPQGSAAATWYVDISALEVQRTLDELYNAIYASYQDASNSVLRTAANTDSASVARYGLTRRRVQDAQTTSATQANAQRDAVLADTKNPRPRSGITVARLFDANGARWPLTSVRAGDTVIIRNLPPTLSTSIDRIRVFRLTRSEYHADDNTLTMEPEAPLPTLEAQLALALPPAWVTDPWWVIRAQK